MGRSVYTVTTIYYLNFSVFNNTNKKETCKETGNYDPKTGKKNKSKQQKLP